MKTNLKLIFAGVLMGVLAMACENIDGLADREVFYYYGIENRKIILNRVTDKVFVKFAPEITKEQFNSVVHGTTSLKGRDENFVEGGEFNTAILEGKYISPKTLNSLKARDEVASATYMLEYEGVISAYTDEFIVKLNARTSRLQLLKLAKRYDCRIGAENRFVKNQFILYVSKKSRLDAIQAANRFYETGLFEFAEPNFIMFNTKTYGSYQ